MRSLAPDMDPDVVAVIDRRLASVASEHGVAVPWAIESGSRAWGFPSPDSDYDCRFFYVRPAADYASPWRPKDVIETPLDAVLDVNGWDLIKAVKLAVNGNATVAEWLRSPLVYDGDPAFRDELLALFRAVADRNGIGRHYLHVGMQQWHRSGASQGDDVNLKQLFYAIRPAAAIHWMAANDSPIPPMNLAELLDGAPPPGDVREAITELVAAKRVTRELGSGTVPSSIRGFVGSQFAWADERFEHAPTPRRPEARALATTAFRDIIDTWAPR